ncbi:MAG: hypothetical protein L6W00_03105 [Lentisphaeria bacterium]|nr:MAG: hypothetical protein L6W00_03105 [Lentisphaeria bacterium]
MGGLYETGYRPAARPELPKPVAASGGGPGVKRRIDYSTGAQITGILLTLAPLPLILAEFHPELRGSRCGNSSFRPLRCSAELSGRCGCSAGVVTGGSVPRCSGLAASGRRCRGSPGIHSRRCCFPPRCWGALFTLWELHLRPFPPEFEVTRPRALAGLLTALGMLLISPFSDQGGAILYRGALAGSTVMALSLFLAWAVRAAHSRPAQWFGAVSIGVILAGFFSGGSWSCVSECRRRL